MEQSVSRDIVASETIEHRALFNGLLRIAAQPLEMFIESYGRRTSFTRPSEGQPGNDARDVLAAGLRTFRVDCAWVLNADDTVRLQSFADDEPALPPPALPPPAGRSQHLHFYFTRAGVPYELVGRKLAADGRSPSTPRGWIIAANRLDLEALNAPALPIDGRVVILPPDAAPDKAAGAFVQIDKALPGFDGKPTAMLRLYYAPDELAILSYGLRLKLIAMAGFVCAVLGLLAFCLWRWVIRPAGVMQSALVTGEAAHLQPLLAGGGDFGRLAALVRDLIESRGALRRALEERARLDRDLHDGVIQTIYSSGMGLTNARALVRSDPAAAEEVLDRIHRDLSGTIREVRGMLAGLAPERAAHRSFGEIGAAILEQARTTNPKLRISVDVDEALAAQMTLAQRAQLLQFVRECVSNASRHAQATLLSLSLGRSGAATCMEITDDGMGFDPANVHGGRGLPNLKERARILDATIVIDAAPGRGTRVRLRLPFPKKHD